MEKIKQDILSLFPKPAPSSSYTAPSSTYSEPEEPELYSPPKSNHPRQANVGREPLLSKFMKDFSKVNNWVAIIVFFRPKISDCSPPTGVPTTDPIKVILARKN